ncbi:TatD family hydrolase [Clostridium sp. AM58-1XD]|uniref:TatD family hydrolase n=1 Tax=Clostridium sp. AM58-1XD TaxID=2292307 RepID=UPI000E4CE4CB|nr:TatD family hydrolase [Clostridium sp. AM58-1XD]RGY96915.1 hydrolase TatD [Clostridium sp. AM58-1XD]
MERIFDAHAHLGTEEERRIRKEQGIRTIYCASDPKEAKLLKTVMAEDGKQQAYGSFGLHPWNAGKIRFEDMKPYLDHADIIGEIGMDSVWCENSLTIQEEVFRRQLELACRENKPVILHTKGQEQRTADIIKEYPGRYLVHWYSDEKGEGFETFLALGCYFTVGPDGEKCEAVKRVIRDVPLSKLLIETDGWPAVCWALGEVPMESMSDILLQSTSLIAMIKHVDVETVKKQLEKNFTEFIKAEYERI